jgi:hypothetical protein
MAELLEKSPLPLHGQAERETHWNVLSQQARELVIADLLSEPEDSKENGTLPEALRGGSGAKVRDSRSMSLDR